MSEFVKDRISIVIPVYYSEKTLEACLESVVNQTYKNIEVIVVDGKSEDDSLTIAERYAKKYAFVHVYSIKNEGVSVSRNYGMEKASGEYLQFADSDDFLMPNACEHLFAAIKSTKADVVIAGFEIMKTGEMRMPKAGVYEGAKEFAQQIEQYYFYKKNCMNTPWNKLYKREGLTASFPVNLSMGEDLLFNLQVFEKAKRIAVISDVVYRYNNVNDESLAYRYRADGFEIEAMLYREVSAFVHRYGVSEDKVLYNNFMFGIKAKITSLVKKSGLNARECQKKIKAWTYCPEVQELLDKKMEWKKKDRILLFMMRHHMSGTLYLYYRIMAG